MSRQEHLDHARLLARVSGLPVNGDFEDGYGRTPQDVAATVEAAVGAGLAGIGIEDTTGDPDRPIRDFEDTVRRLTAFAEAGADVLCAPYPPDLDSVGAIVRAVAPKPVNVLISPADQTLTVAELQQAGVKRISLGGALYSHVMAALEQAARSLASGDLAPATTGLSSARRAELLEKAAHLRSRRQARRPVPATGTGNTWAGQVLVMYKYSPE